VAKLVGGTQLQFTIGATQLGNAHSMNDTIREIISYETNLIEAHSSDGSHSPRKEYPALDISKISGSGLRRLLHRIEGVILQAQRLYPQN